jgi:hypothetical protein
VPAELRRIARETWPFFAGLLLGLAIGGVWTLLQADRYRAETHVLLGGSSAARLGSAVETLANGSVLQQNVKQTLRLANAPDLSASVDGNVLTMSAEAGSPERARQADAEAVQVLTQLVGARFGSQGVHASLLDQAHVAEQTSPTPARNLLICGLLGLVAGAGGAYLRSRHLDPTVSASSGVVDPNLERRLRQRVDEVTKRERALARRAGELAKREADLEQRRGELDQLASRLTERDADLGATKKQLADRAGSIAASERELAARAAEPPPAPPPPQPEPEPAPTPAAVAPTSALGRVGSWNVNALQRTVDSQSGATVEQAEDWRNYLYLLREHASADGSLPPQFDGLVEDVFGELTP